MLFRRLTTWSRFMVVTRRTPSVDGPAAIVPTRSLRVSSQIVAPKRGRRVTIFPLISNVPLFALNATGAREVSSQTDSTTICQFSENHQQVVLAAKIGIHSINTVSMA